MTIDQWIQVGIFAVPATIAIISAVAYINKIVNVLREEMNRKDGRIYERFDEYKNHIEGIVDNKFVKREMCDVLHKANAEAFSVASTKLDMILTELVGVKTTIATYVQRIDTNTKRIDRLENGK